MSIILKTNNLTKRFKATLALNEVNMTINKGDIYGFVGENGSGKTTLIRLITNIINPTSGSFNVNVGKRLGSLAAIVETPALHHKLTAFDNLKFQTVMLDVPKTEEEINMLLKNVGLEEQINSKKSSKDFSLGMKQRLAIGMALISEPEFIILDEPMNGLDPVGIKEMRELILRLNKENNTTFLISSHLLSELDKIATTYGFISKGQLLKEISSEDLHSLATGFTRITLTKPLTEDLKTLISEIEYTEESPISLLIDNEANGQKLMQVLVANNITIQKYDIVKETIEDYYLKIITKGEKL